MKIQIKRLILATLLAGVSLFALAETAAAQGARIQLGGLDKLDAKADRTIDVTLDERLIRLASIFLDPKDPDERAVKELVAGLKGVYVKSYEFPRNNEYTESDVEPIREQVKKAPWMRVVEVKTRSEHENVEVYTYIEAEKINGVTVIVSDKNELTIVNIVGAIDLEKLSLLEGRIGIPRLRIEFPKGTKKP